MQKRRDDIFDLIIIGSGIAGFDIALQAIKKGCKTAMVDPNDIGGVCLHTGCIPLKSILKSADVYSEAKKAGDFGVNIKGISLDFNKVMQRAKKIISDLQKTAEMSIKNGNLTIFREYASFVSERKVKVGNKIIEGRKVIIATGAKPHMPMIKGLEKTEFFLSGTIGNEKNDIFNIGKIPKTLLVLGGSHAGFDFAVLFSLLGSKVIVLEETGNILPGIDDEILEILLGEYLKDNVSVIKKSRVIEVKEENGMKKIYYSDSKGQKKSVAGDAILIATGKIPNTFEMGLEKAGIEKDERGAIKVNGNMETTCKGIYAVGDVTGTMSANMAVAGERVAFSNAMDNQGKKVDFSSIPWEMFYNPTIVGVGNTSNGVMKAMIATSSKSKIIGDYKGIIKVWYDKKTGKIQGMQAIGEETSNLLGEFSALIKFGAKINDLKEMVHPHPSLSEAIDFLR